MSRALAPLVVFLLAKLLFFGALYVWWSETREARALAAEVRAEGEHLGALVATHRDPVVQTSRDRLQGLLAQGRSADNGAWDWLEPVLLLASVVLFTAVLALAWVQLQRARRVGRRADEAMRSLQSLLSAAPFAFMAWNSRRGMILWSDAAERMFGLARADVLGRPLPQALERLRALEECTRSDQHDGATPAGVAMDLQDIGGASLHAHVSISRLPTSGDGSDTVAAVIEDVTPRRLQEARRLDAVRAQRDALVREVHHRIKNHLQGVAGLLRQHLAGKPLLQPLLEVATAQVLTIAAVHGLQGEVGGGELNLRMLLARIASSISGIMHAPIEMIDQCDALGDLTVTEEEAVPVAMVLNEVLMNAVKHRAPIDGDATVRIAASRNGDDALIAVSNPGFLPPRFNLALGVHVGTGLGLVKSLLPQRGAGLEIVEDGHSVIARLQLSTPHVLSPPLAAPQESPA